MKIKLEISQENRGINVSIKRLSENNFRKTSNLS